MIRDALEKDGESLMKTKKTKIAVIVGCLLIVCLFIVIGVSSVIRKIKVNELNNEYANSRFIRDFGIVGEFEYHNNDIVAQQYQIDMWRVSEIVALYNEYAGTNYTCDDVIIAYENFLSGNGEYEILDDMTYVYDTLHTNKSDFDMVFIDFIGEAQESLYNETRLTDATDEEYYECCVVAAARMKTYLEETHEMYNEYYINPITGESALN